VRAHTHTHTHVYTMCFLFLCMLFLTAWLHICKPKIRRRSRMLSCAHTHAHTHIHTHTHTYTHTYIHTQSLSRGKPSILIAYATICSYRLSIHAGR